MDWEPQAPLTALQAAAGVFFFCLDMRLLKKVCFCHFLSIFGQYWSIFVNIDQGTSQRDLTKARQSEHNCERAVIVSSMYGT